MIDTAQGSINMNFSSLNTVKHWILLNTRLKRCVIAIVYQICIQYCNNQNLVGRLSGCPWQQLLLQSCDNANIYILVHLMAEMLVVCQTHVLEMANNFSSLFCAFQTHIHCTNNKLRVLRIQL